jgi:hypothetical protein
VNKSAGWEGYGRFVGFLNLDISPHLSLSRCSSTFFLFFLIKKERKKSRALENSLKICAAA